jgi:hypothetical protein
MEIMKKYKFLSVFLAALIISGCASSQKNCSKLKVIPKDSNEVTIQYLIDKWDDYHVYSYDQCAGPDLREPLGIMFDPKNNDTMLVGGCWKKVKDQKTLTVMTKRIFLATYHEPWLNEILGPNGQLYGYLYYSYGVVPLKMVGDNKMYVFCLEELLNEGGDY